MMQDLTFFVYGRGRWPGNSPDLNPAEHLGAIVKERAEAMLGRVRGERNSREVLVRVLKKTLKSVEKDVSLFERLLKSFRMRLTLVGEAGGKSIKKY